MMKIINDKEYYSGTESAKMVGRSYRTILYWYDAQEYAKEHGKQFPGTLPEPMRGDDVRKSRYWDKEGIDELIKFKDSLKSGSLSFYSRTLWGKRGEAIEARAKARLDEKEEENVEK